MDTIHTNRLKAYLLTRDEYRAKAELPPLWQTLNIPLASELWQFTTNTTNRSLCNRLLFDKHWHGRNQAKAIKDDPILHALTSKCPLCVYPDSVQHWTTQCIHPRAQTIRKDTITKLRQQIKTTAQLIPAHSNTIHYFGNDYLSLVTGPNSAPDIWRGLWTSGQLNTFSSAYYQYIPAPVIPPLKKLFLQLGRTLTSSCISLWIARQKTIYDLVEYMYMHPHPDFNFPTYTHNFPNAKDMPPLTEEQLNKLRTNATEQQQTPITKISLHSTQRKVTKTTNDSTEQPTDTTLIANRTETHTITNLGDTSEHMQNQVSTALLNPISTTDSASERNTLPLQDTTITVSNSQDTPTQPPKQSPAQPNQGQLFAQHLQRMAINTKYKPIQGGKGKVHQLRITDSNKPKTDTTIQLTSPVLPPQRTTNPHHSSQQTMEEQIQKMQKQLTVQIQTNRTTTEIHQTPAPATPNTTDTNDTDTHPAQNSRLTSPTEDTSDSTDGLNRPPEHEHTKERRGNFPEARRTHEPP